MEADIKINPAVKTTVFNLIILDESGSMRPLVKSTISGCNETLNVIRTEQTKTENQRHLVSVYAFQSGGEIPSRFIVKNKPVAQVNDLTAKDYRPWGNTPLYDAVGMTLTDLEAIASTHEDATAVVTIITDGYENDSREYTGKMVADMIQRLKKQGWTFNFIGANVDVEAVSRKLNIDNAMNWECTEKGTSEMYKKYQVCYSNCMRTFEEETPDMSVEERRATRIKRSGKFFDMD